MYEIWWSQGNGTQKGPKFRRLSDAQRYVFEHAGQASFAIRGPVGYWVKWDDTGRIAFDRSRPASN